ncbi:MAG TPA: RHS repeat-associated core domain-containing protein [Gemmatimonadales bacterium]|nr:RHS repeat-associated core domain-containing protein [Gemmatimonadales bacterium]
MRLHGPNAPETADGDYSVSVSPDGAAETQPINTSNLTIDFNVTNTGICDDTYGIVVTRSGSVTSASPSASNLFLAAGTGGTITVTYSVGAAGSGVVKLTASGSFAVSDTGTLNVTVVAPGVAVTPDGGAAPPRPANTGGYGQTFTVTNTGATALSVTFSCGGTGVTCTGTSLSSASLSGGADTAVTAFYGVGAAGTGTLRLTAAGGGVSDSGTYVVPIISRAVAVRAELPQRQHFAGVPGSQRFFVKNLQPATAVYSLSAVCSGTITGCGATPGVDTLLAYESRVVTANYTLGAGDTTNATVRIKATDQANSAFRDSGTVAVRAVTKRFPVVSIADVNPGTSLDRGECLTVAAGSAAAFECGDLRIVHALPAIRTLNKARVPTLIYNSAAADPYPIVAATVSLASDTTVPDSVEAALKINNVTMAQGLWVGTNWVPGATRRIALGSATLTDTTSLADTTKVIDYTLEVTTVYRTAPGSRNSTVASGRLIVVNRRRSSFGAGWWLAGVERLSVLSDSSRLLVGGDGSARLYAPAGSNTWVASGLDGPDTLVWGGTGYVHRLPGGLTVTFNSAGRHVATVNRLGHTTAFRYDSIGRLLKILLPPDTTYLYQFVYNSTSGLLDSVMAPPIGSVKRAVKLTLSGSRMNALRGPDLRTVNFGYDGATNRIATRTDRRGTVTSYSYDAARKLSRVKIDLQPDSIRTGFHAVDSVGLANATPNTATDTANAYTSIYGARHFARGVDSVGQETKFWLDPRGAVRKIVNAAGSQTLVKREDGQWSMPATGLTTFDGFVTRAFYDWRGNIVQSTAVGPFGPGQGDAIMRYHWDPVWDFADSVITPMGVVTTMAYDAANGNRLWQQVGPDPARRVTFRYNNSFNFLSATVLPGTPPDSIDYDTARGNLSATRTPLRYWVSHYTDSLGRDTLVVTPINATDTLKGGTQDNTIRQRQRVVYTVMDQDSIAESIAPNQTQILRVEKRFDAEGNDTLLSQTPLGIPSGVGTVTTLWRYDRANRRVAEIAPNGQRDSTVYDPAGNVVTVLTRCGHTITMKYDTLNRLTTRVVPQVTYDSLASAFDSWASYQQSPYFLAYTIPRDSVVLRYDAMSRISTANNRYARISRSYFPGGLLNADTLRIQALDTTNTNWDLHKYIVRHTYDLDGRETSLYIPSQLGDAQLFGDIDFGYNAQSGELSSIADLKHDTYSFHYKARGDLDTLYFPGQHKEWFALDADGRLLADTINNWGGTTFPRFNGSVLRAMNYQYDAQGRLLWSGNSLGARDTLTVTYSGLGSLATSRLKQRAYGPPGVPDATFISNETFTFDALGNRTRAVTYDTISPPFTPPNSSTLHGSSYQPGTGRLQTDTLNLIITSYTYDSAGNIRLSSNPGYSSKPGEERASYYAADGTVRAVDWRWISSSTPDFRIDKFTFDEYRYDALGRRIWMWSKRRCYGFGADPGTKWREYMECSTSLVRRTVWNRSQELVEIQMPGDTALHKHENDVSLLAFQCLPNRLDMNQYFGRVVYIPGRGIDQPLAATRINYEYWWYESDGQSFCHPTYIALPPITSIPFWNGNDDAPLGVYTNGAQAICPNPPPDTFRCIAPLWSFFYSAFDRHRVNSPSWIHPDWHGTLLVGKQDQNGLQFMRHRYYDPATGRFTQEDPIGLAGGLNLYGFAGGDPVNFSDPFGLCPEKLRDSEEKCKKWDLTIVERKIAQIQAKSPVRFMGIGLTEARGKIGATAGAGIYCNDVGCGGYLSSGPAKGNSQFVGPVFGVSTNLDAFRGTSAGGEGGVGPFGGSLTGNQSGLTSSLSFTHPLIGPRVGGAIIAPTTGVTEPSPMFRVMLIAGCSSLPGTYLCALP